PVTNAVTSCPLATPRSVRRRPLCPVAPKITTFTIPLRPLIAGSGKVVSVASESQMEIPDPDSDESARFDEASVTAESHSFAQLDSCVPRAERSTRTKADLTAGRVRYQMRSRSIRRVTVFS